ncbi:diguanylate cyclase [Vibrio sp. TBV020]|uniref:tetratricopeptide repeat-containing diguanylate cyclase n=1 Tax=Vibrio sp. TBV020 TaxID=3137398 RepID=UPI0038CD341A
MLSEPAKALKLVKSVHYSSLTTAEQLHYTHLYVSSNNLLGNYADSKQWIEEYSLPEPNSIKLTKELFDFSIRAAWAYEATQHYQQAMQWYRKAENYGARLGNHDKQGYVYLQYSAVESLQGNQYEALKLANEAYILLIDSVDKAMVSDLYSQLGILYYLNGDYGNAIQFQEKVLKQAIDDNSIQETAVAYYNLANAYYKWSKVDNSERHIQAASLNYQRGLELAQNIEAKYLQRNNLLGLISLYTYSNAIEDASRRLEQLLDLQLEYSGYSKLSYHLVLADYYKVVEDIPKLQWHLDKATQYYAQEDVSFPAYALDKQKEVADLYAAIGQHEDAYHWLESYSTNAIGRYKSQTQQKVKELQSEIENQRLAMENRELNHQVQTRFWLITAMCLVLALSIGLLYQQRKKKQQFYHLSNTDFLTGLANRRHIFEWGESQFSSRKLSSIIFDIDHFKTLNDTYGHEFGDQVLKQVSSIVNQSARKEDVVGRIGGEEFLILLPSIGRDELSTIAENIRALISTHQFVTPDNQTIKVTASFGIAEHRSGALSDQVNLADTALYSAKRSGRNRCVFSN